jgi:hypothetical protein
MNIFGSKILKTTLTVIFLVVSRILELTRTVKFKRAILIKSWQCSCSIIHDKLPLKLLPLEYDNSFCTIYLPLVWFLLTVVFHSRPRSGWVQWDGGQGASISIVRRKELWTQTSTTDRTATSKANANKELPLPLKETLQSRGFIRNVSAGNCRYSFLEFEPKGKWTKKEIKEKKVKQRKESYLLVSVTCNSSTMLV